MKKLLSILAAVGLTATASSAVVACTTKTPMSDGIIDMHVKNTKDLVWGEDSKVTIKKDGKDVTVSTLTALLENSKDKKIEAIAKHIKKELGISSFRDKDNNPILFTTYFGETKPAYKDGDIKDNEGINVDMPADRSAANAQALPEQAAAGKTVYIVLRADKTKFSQKVAVVKVEFTKLAK